MTDRLGPFICPLITAALIGGMLSGCASNTLLTSRLDSNGLTVVSLDDPIVQACAVRQLSSSARDYAYLGPVEINRMGKRDYFVWIGLASTIDRKLVAMSPAKVTELTLLVDGWPMTLLLADWNAGLDQSPYHTTAPLYATYAARISLDQIRRVANAGSVQVWLKTASGAIRRYMAWEGEWSSWSLLVAAQ